MAFKDFEETASLFFRPAFAAGDLFAEEAGAGNQASIPKNQKPPQAEEEDAMSMRKIGLMIAMLCGFIFGGCIYEQTNDEIRRDVTQKIEETNRGYYKDWDADICYNVYKVHSYQYDLILKTYVPCTEKVLSKIVNPRNKNKSVCTNECQKKSEPLPAERIDQK